MKDVVSNIFWDLWKMNIRSEIFIMGDDADRHHNIDHNDAIADLNRVTYDKFISFLIGEGYIENEKEIRAHWPLINMQDGIIPHADTASNQMIILEKNFDVVNSWKHLNKSDISSNEYSVEEIVNSILNLISDKKNYSNVIIMLDLCLIENDYKKLSSNDESLTNVPVFSMALYHELVKKCGLDNIVLYSTYVVPTDLVNRWKSIYVSIFNNDKIDVYNRKGELYDDSHNDNTLINRIKGMKELC